MGAVTIISPGRTLNPPEVSCRIDGQWLTRPSYAATHYRSSPSSFADAHLLCASCLPEAQTRAQELTPRWVGGPGASAQLPGRSAGRPRACHPARSRPTPPAHPPASQSTRPNGRMPDARPLGPQLPASGRFRQPLNVRLIPRDPRLEGQNKTVILSTRWT